MNDKLKIWEQGKISERSFGKNSKGRSSMATLISMAKHTEIDKDKSGNPSGSTRDVMRITFHRKILDLTGWKVGDVLDMEIKNGQAVVFRSSAGVKLCQSQFKTGRVYIRVSYPLKSLDDLPIGDCREVEAKPSAVAFLLPEIFSK